MMPSFNFKKKIFIALIISAVFLLVANILMQKNLFVSASDELEFDEDELNQKFKNILTEYGIEDKLIKESKSTDKGSNNKIPNFKIQVPRDLSIPQILQGIYISFRKDSITFNSVEKIKGGKSNLTMKLGSTTLLQAEFDYAKNYLRNFGSIAFIIYDVDPENPSILSLIESPTKLNFLIRPETKYLQNLDFIAKNYQQFSVLIDDDISEQKYQLGPGFSEQRIVTVAKTLITDFKKAVYFVVDDNSDFYKSSKYEVLKRELLKRNIKLFKTSDFVNLKNDETILTFFNEKLESIKNGESMIFLADVDTFLELRPDIVKYRKKGYRVINSSLIL